MPTSKLVPGRVSGRAVATRAAGGRITGCSAQPVNQQAGSHKVGGVEVFVSLRDCVCVLNRNLLCSGAVVPHWCLYDVNKSCLTEDSTLRALPLPYILSFTLSLSHRGISPTVLCDPLQQNKPQHTAKSFGLGCTSYSLIDPY